MSYRNKYRRVTQLDSVFAQAQPCAAAPLAFHHANAYTPCGAAGDP